MDGKSKQLSDHQKTILKNFLYLFSHEVFEIKQVDICENLKLSSIENFCLFEVKCLPENNNIIFYLNVDSFELKESGQIKPRNILTFSFLMMLRNNEFLRSILVCSYNKFID